MDSLENQLARLLKHAWANSSTAVTPPIPSKSKKFVMGRGGISFYPDGRRVFYKIVNLLRENLGETISEDMISRLVAKQIARLHLIDKRDIEKSAVSVSHDLLEEFRNLPYEEVKINTPVHGMSLWPRSLTIEVGCVTFYTLFSGVEQDKWSTLFPLGDWKFVNHGLATEESSGGSQTWAKATFDSHVKDYEYQRWEATRLFREALALVSLFIYAIPADRRHLVMPGLMMLDVYEINPDAYERFVKENLQGQKPIGFPFVGVHTTAYPLRLANDDLNNYRTAGFDSCAHCLRTVHNTELQNRVRRSLDYVAMGLREGDRPQRFVWLMTSLEALLLLEDDRGGKVRKLSERIQTLLGNNYPDIEMLYDLRSRIVHGDFVQNSIDSGIQRMEYILYSLIIRLLTAPDEFTTLDQALGVKASGLTETLVHRVVNKLNTVWNRLHDWIG
jgi:hypothetical protein